ncbi:MAG: c-type cytochrome [Acidobacteriaceae bacterium]|nr:c-type cytochrome [Acidobacteriaceae bacterium]MBV9295780.1 c-type cytochrome [Acidobacteriaceae bacterium]
MILRKTQRLLGMVLLAASALFLAGQEPQAPPGNPPPEPPPGAANGPHPGPAAKPPNAGQRPTNEAAAPGRNQENTQNFFGLGAAPDPVSAARGQTTFVTNCAFCHGTNANGGATGPDLVRSVLVLHDEGTGTQIGPVILNGRPDKGMPKFSFNAMQIKDIAQFLLARSQATANRMEYKILNVITGDPKAGAAYFSSHCASCHSATGDLAHIAAKYDAATLQSRFLYPVTRSYPGTPGPLPDPKGQTTVTVTLPSGQSYSGTLEHRDDFSIALSDSSGEYHSWLLDENNGLKIDIHDPLKGHEELLKQYTDADMHNLLAYLETLK